jgi:hypothetical protein
MVERAQDLAARIGAETIADFTVRERMDESPRGQSA